MTTIQKLILPLLLLCQLLLGQSAFADSLKPIDFIKDPSLLANQWQDYPSGSITVNPDSTIRLLPPGVQP